MPRHNTSDTDDDSNSSTFSAGEAGESPSPPKRTTRSRRSTNMDIDTNTTNTAAAAQGEPHSNPMKASLDYGDLKPSSADKTFTSFLDIRPKYHKEFMRGLRKYVQREGYVGDVLVGDEAERRKCAMGFLGKVGMLYWGTEEGRSKFLIPERLEFTDGLAVYPEREDEIARTIMILLEKKGKREWKSEKSAAVVTTDTELRRPHTPPPNHRAGLAAGIRYTPDSKVHDTPGSAEKKKKKLKPSRPLSGPASPFDYRVAIEASGSNNTDIRPFSSITSTLCGDSDGSPRKRKRTDREPSIEPATNVDDLFAAFQDDPVADDTQKDVSQLTSENKAGYQKKTKFLVSATTQQDMAPVWIPYQRFDSATSFLEAMAAECWAEEWGPDAQLNREVHSSNATIRSFSQRVSVASVSFEWTEFAIRVRAGKDRDWAMVMDGLQSSWTKQVAEDYRIDVMLHVG